VDNPAGLQKHVLIAANPKSGAQSSGNQVAGLRQSLLADNYEVDICYSLDELTHRSRDLDHRGVLKTVVAAGGDGTVSAVANLLPAHIPVAVFPLGTENLLAKHLRITRDISLMRQTLKSGVVRRIDVGRANGRLFLVMVGCGFDAEVVRRMHQVRTGHIRRWSYAKPIFDAVRTYSYPEIEIEILDQAAEQMPHGSQASVASYSQSSGENLFRDQATVRAAWLFAFNLPRYAANLPFCPLALDADGLIDICAFRHGGLWRSMGYFWRLWWGQHQRMAEFRHVRSRHFRLSSTGVVPYQLDGDPGGVLPLEVEVLPERLLLIVPAGA